MILTVSLLLVFLSYYAFSTSESSFADGPVVTQWKNTGPYGGVITALAIDPNNPSTLFATTHRGFGVFKSVDGGDTWQVLRDLAFETAYSIAIDPVNSDIILIGSWKTIYKSVDGGNTWRKVFTVEEGGSGYEVNTIAIAPSDHSIIYANLKNRGLLKSTDEGKTWKEISVGVDDFDIETLAVDPQNPSLVYAGDFWNEKGVYRSSDGGNHWTPINNGLQDKWGRTASVRALLIDPQDPLTIYAGGNSVYKSTDGGDSWGETDMRTGGCIQALALDTKNPQVIYAGTCSHIYYPGVYKSINGGGTWSRLSQGLIYPDITALAVAPGEEDVFAGTEGAGVFKSSNGGRNWSAANQGITSVSPCHHCVVIDPQNPSTIYVGTFDSGIYKSKDGGLNWEPIYSGLQYLSFRTLVIDPKDHQRLYAMSNYKLYESVNGGDTWQIVNDQLDLGDVLSARITPTSPPTLFVGTKDGMFKSQDGGRTWLKASNGFDDWVWEIAIVPLNPSMMYAAGSHGVYKSRDGGKNWRQLPFYRHLGAYSYVVVDPEDLQRVYIANPGGVYRSDDGGDSWTQMNNGLQPDFNTQIALDSARPNQLYVAAGTRVYQSDNRAQTWSDMNFSLDYERIWINNVAADARTSGSVYISVWGKGLYARRKVTLDEKLHLPLFVHLR